MPRHLSAEDDALFFFGVPRDVTRAPWSSDGRSHGAAIASIHSRSWAVCRHVRLIVERTEHLSDASLLAGMAAGDREACVAFIQRFERTVYGLALSMLGDRELAQDVAQETFSRAWRHAHAYDPRFMARVFSGMQPTGDATLGSLLGALRNWVDDQGPEALYCVVDQEISHLEQIPLGTAKTRIRAGLQKVRALLDDEAGRSD